MLLSSPCSSCTPGRSSSPTEGWCASPSRCSLFLLVASSFFAAFLLFFWRILIALFVRLSHAPQVLHPWLLRCCSLRFCFSFGACCRCRFCCRCVALLAAFLLFFWRILMALFARLAHAPQVLQVSRTRAIAARVTRSARSKNKLRLSVARTRESIYCVCYVNSVLARALAFFYSSIKPRPRAADTANSRNILACPTDRPKSAVMRWVG
jgi:hypothetical protein